MQLHERDAADFDAPHVSQERSQVIANSLSIVVPVFNSHRSIALLVNRLHKVLLSTANCFEVLLVDDGSQDSTWDIVSCLAEQFTWIRGIRLMRNYGQHNALLCGIRQARYQFIVTLDDDLQNPPEEIPRLIRRLIDGADVVYGTPPTQTHGFLRDAASYITKIALQNSMGVETARSVSAFRAFRSEVVRGFESYRGSFVSIDVLLTWGTTRIAAIPVRQDERLHGTSQYTVHKLVRHALNMVTGFTALPLQVSTIIGFLFGLMGFGALLLVLGRYLLNGTAVPGFTFLASLIALFFGVQFFALGVIGEYLARMHFRLLDRPTYAVRSTTEKETQHAQTAASRTASLGF